MVMPFGTKETRAKPPAPIKLNFNSLWEKAISPALEELGYQPVRADQDLGALIIQEMLERLYFSDLVVADLTIPERKCLLRDRHSPRGAQAGLCADERGLVASVVRHRPDASTPLPVAEEEVSDETAAKIREDS